MEDTRPLDVAETPTEPMALESGLPVVAQLDRLIDEAADGSARLGERLRDWLRDTDHRLIALVGVAGVILLLLVVAAG